MGLGFTDEIATMEMDKGAAMMSASLDSMGSMNAVSSSSSTQFHSSTTSIQSTQSTISSSTGYSSMAASTQSLSKSSSMSQSSTSLTSSSQSMTVEKKAIQTSSSSSSTVERQAIQAAVVEQKEIAIENESMQTAAAIEHFEPTVVKSAVTQVVSKPNVIVKETIHLFAGTLSYSTRSASHITYEEVLPPVNLKDGWIYVEEEGILAVRQFDFAPSPVKEIQLYTSVTKDPPVEFAIPVVKKKIHTTNASLITIEKGELILIKEEIEEDEGMFEEFWEEVRVAHYEEELRKKEHRRMMMEERIEETRRIQERRQVLLKRIEESKGIYAYSGRRSSTMSLESPYSYRSMDSFGSVAYSPR